MAIPDSPSNSPSSALTIDAWIKPARINQQQIFISKYNNATSQDAYTLNSDATGSKLEFRVYQTGDSGGSYRIIQTTASVLSVNVWTHIAATFDTATQAMKIYVNGVDMPTSVIETNGTITSIFNSVEPVRLGDFINGAGNHVLFFQGLIDEAQIYSRAFSATEIQNIYNAGSTGVCYQLSPNAWYKGEGNANDSSGNNNTGVLNNGITFVAGKVGQAFSLDGIDDFAIFPDTPNNSPTRAITLDVWAKPTLMTKQVLVSKFNNTGTTGQSFYLDTDATGTKVRFFVFESTDTGIYRSVQTTSDALTLDQFTHIAATFDTVTQTMQIYVNGVNAATTVISSAAVNTINDSTTQIRLGAYRDGNGDDVFFFHGLLDEMQIYNRALSASEIQQQYLIGSVGASQGSTFTGIGSSSSVAPLSNLNLTFSSVTQAGNTVAALFASSQLPVLPQGYSFYSPLQAYDIRTSAIFSGGITVVFNVPNVASNSICSTLRMMHFENEAWTTNTNGAPQYNAGTQICTLTQTVTSLSPFAVAQLPTTAASVSVGGRILTADGRGIRNTRVILTDSSGTTRTALSSNFGFYNFENIPAGETVIITVAAKRYAFSQPQQVLNVQDNVGDLNFTALEDSSALRK